MLSLLCFVEKRSFGFRFERAESKEAFLSGLFVCPSVCERRLLEMPDTVATKSLLEKVVDEISAALSGRVFVIGEKIELSGNKTEEYSWWISSVDANRHHWGDGTWHCFTWVGIIIKFHTAQPMSSAARLRIHTCDASGQNLRLFDSMLLTPGNLSDKKFTDYGERFVRICVSTHEELGYFVPSVIIDPEI